MDAAAVNVGAPIVETLWHYARVLSAGDNELLPRTGASTPMGELAPRRQSLLRPERGLRPALRLSRLGVRRGRALRRHADYAARERLP